MRDIRFKKIIAASMAAFLIVSGFLGAWIVYICLVPADSQKENDQSVLGNLRRHVTEAVGRQIDRRIRKRAVASYLRTKLNDEEVIKRFLDDSTPIQIRRLDAWRMAEKIGTPHALSILYDCLDNGSDELRSIVAEALGHSGKPQVKQKLISLLKNETNPKILLGVIRGLIAFGDDECVDILAGMLNSPQTAMRLRLEIAWRLGDLDTPVAFSTLKKGYSVAEDDELRGVLLESLGKYPFKPSQDIFKTVINAKDAQTELKTQAVEALADSDSDALAYLASTAMTHQDAEVRAAAAWAIGENGSSGDLGDLLAEQVTKEDDATVRRRLYEAMKSQKSISVTTVKEQLTFEDNPATRIAAANALAIGIHKSSNTVKNSEWFDQNLVPELLESALSTTTTNLRMRSVFALWRAGTPESEKALEAISTCETPKVAKAARNALQSLNRKTN